MNWINFLHIYQPANSDPYVIKEATEMSYKRIVKALEKNPEIKFTLNITGCLFLRWKELGYDDLIKRIKKLVEKGQVELVGSASYHPLLPLISIQEAKKQIEENNLILKEIFGDIKIRGFFLPEMAYGRKTAKLIKELGFEWIILDEISSRGKLGEIDNNYVYQDRHSGLKIIFRSRKKSSCYVPQLIKKELKKKKAI